MNLQLRVYLQLLRKTHICIKLITQLLFTLALSMYFLVLASLFSYRLFCTLLKFDCSRWNIALSKMASSLVISSSIHVDLPSLLHSEMSHDVNDSVVEAFTSINYLCFSVIPISLVELLLLTAKVI